jgi:hypothetical protein
MRAVHHPDRESLFDRLGMILGVGAMLAVVAGQAYFVVLLWVQP